MNRLAHPLLAAGSGVPTIVESIALAFMAAAAVSLVFERIRLPSTAAFITAGVVIGPIGLGLVHEPEQIETLASLGLVLLLFLIGLELELRALLAGGRTLIVTGLLQVPLTAGLAFAVFTGLAALGLRSAGPYASLYLALACAFSSTLLVVRVLHHRMQLDSEGGRLCIALLIFQDLWALIVLALQPNLAAPELAPLLATLLGVCLVIAVAWLMTRVLLPRAFLIVAKVPELVLTLALGWCFGLGLFASRLGSWAAQLGLPAQPTISIELGALVAGMSIAALPYAHELVAKASNLRDFFITLFFVALGMSISMPSSIQVLFAALLLVAVMLALRVLVFLPLLLFTGLDRRHAITTSTKLAQVSEFALVIAYLGVSLGHIDPELVSVVLLAFVFTAILTPPLFTLADGLFAKLGFGGYRELRETPAEPAPRLVLLGFHRLGSALLRDLEATRAELLAETLIVDLNVALHDRIRAHGVRVVYGDVANPAMLQAMLRGCGACHGQVILSTLPDDVLKGITNLELTRQLRRLAPHARILVNAVRLCDVANTYAAGADYVFCWRTEASFGLLPALCAALDGRLDGFVDAHRRDRGDPTERDEVLD